MKKAAILFTCFLLVFGSIFPQAVSADAPAVLETLAEDSSPMIFHPGKATKILLIGNSYTYYNGFEKILKNLCESAGRKVIISSVTKSGANLSLFAGKQTPEGKKVHRLLAGQKWDYVILQERHDFPLVCPEKMCKAVHSLKPYIKASGAKLALFMTWAPAVRHSDYEIFKPLVTGLKDYQRKIASAYKKAAKENNAIVIPTGLAFGNIRQQKTGIPLIRQDKSHPTFAGSYLSACTMYATLFGTAPTASYTGELKARTAKALQQCAKRTVTKYKKS